MALTNCKRTAPADIASEVHVADDRTDYYVASMRIGSEDHATGVVTDMRGKVLPMPDRATREWVMSMLITNAVSDWFDDYR